MAEIWEETDPSDGWRVMPADDTAEEHIGVEFRANGDTYGARAWPDPGWLVPLFHVMCARLNAGGSIEDLQYAVDCLRRLDAELQSPRLLIPEGFEWVGTAQEVAPAIHFYGNARTGEALVLAEEEFAERTTLAELDVRLVGGDNHDPDADV